MRGSAAAKVATSGPAMIGYVTVSRAASSIWSRLGASIDSVARCRALLPSSALHAKGLDLYLHQQGLDTGTPAGKAMFQMLSVFSEFERAMIVERV
jgi:hypothetical protein